MNFRRVVGIFSVVSTIMSFYACGDDKSSSANSLPDEVADKAELETYECNMSVIGGKVFVKSLGKNYECDGDEWFESYDQPKSSAKGKSSSSSENKSSLSSGKSSSSSGKSSSSSSSVGKQSSSSEEELQEPEIKVKESCSKKGACYAMDMNDVSTWHFVRKDDFGDDAEYIYKADGRDLIVTIKSADGSTSSDTYSMYNMESEVGVEMAYRAAKSTCEEGGGNDKKIETCVKDTTWRLPKCTKEREGMEGKDSTGKDVVCRDAGWHNKIVYGSLTDERDGQVYKTVKIGKQWWMAQNLNFTYMTPDSGIVRDNACVADSLCEKYGRMYQWSIAVDSNGVYSSDALDCGYFVMESSCGKVSNNAHVRGICPENWHIPSFNEFETLIGSVGGDVVLFRSNSGDPDVGRMLKSSVDWNGNDEYGFSLLPAGGINGGFGYYIDLWTSTEYYSSMNGQALFVRFEGFSGNVAYSRSEKFYRAFVRCVKDE